MKLWHHQVSMQASNTFSPVSAWLLAMQVRVITPGIRSHMITASQLPTASRPLVTMVSSSQCSSQAFVIAASVDCSSLQLTDMGLSDYTLYSSFVLDHSIVGYQQMVHSLLGCCPKDDTRSIISSWPGISDIFLQPKLKGSIFLCDLWDWSNPLLQPAEWCLARGMIYRPAVTCCMQSSSKYWYASLVSPGLHPGVGLYLLSAANNENHHQIGRVVSNCHPRCDCHPRCHQVDPVPYWILAH